MNTNSYSNKLQNYSSKNALHQRYQSPNSGSNNYFLTSNKNNAKTGVQASQNQPNSSQMSQNQVQVNSQTATGIVGQSSQIQPQTQQVQQNLGQNLEQNYIVQQQAVQLYSQQGASSQNQQQHQTNPSPGGHTSQQISTGNKSQTQKNINQYQSPSNNSQNPQQQSSTYSNIQQRLKQTKHKSQNVFSTTQGNFSSQSPSLPFGTSQGGHASSLSSQNYGVTSSLVINQNKMADKSKQQILQSQQFRHSTNGTLRDQDKNSAFIGSSTRVKTDYSLDRKGGSDLLLTTPARTSTTKNTGTSAGIVQNNSNNIYNSTINTTAQGINGSNIFQSSSNGVQNSSIATQDTPQPSQNGIQYSQNGVQYNSNGVQPSQVQINSYLDSYQNKNVLVKTQSQNSQQNGQSTQNMNNYRQLLKKHKSQQISEVLKTDPNVGDYHANLTVFIHYKGKRIGPISLNAIGRNVEWLTKQLITEIFMYESIQMPSNPESNNESFDSDNIVHFQSYQHRNISLSYYLTLPERPLDPLFNKSLILEPFYSEMSVSSSVPSTFNHTELRPATVNQQPSLSKENTTHHVSLKDFHFIKCVGMGGFSRVYLVQKKDNGKMYALKLIEKKFIITNKKEVIVQNERNIMTIMQGHPFLLQLDYAFESKNYIAFAMEYCAGGEMFYHLRKIKKMTEEQARFYFIEICLGIDFLHDRHIIYRDIKPENILLDIDGHIRIGDFGLSKPDMDENEFAYSFCGSPEYMAPEMLLKVGHAYPVDHYTLGALLYELVTGLPPFYSQITEEIYKSILNEDLTFPDHVNLSSELKHLLRGLLTKHPLQRLGLNMGTKEILSHPWCRKISLSDIIYKRIEPPIKIDVMGFNFDEEEFSKGENEFKAKLVGSYYSNNNEFDSIFLNFYYESPSVIQAQHLRIEQLKSKRQTKQSNKQTPPTSAISTQSLNQQTNSQNSYVNQQKPINYSQSVNYQNQQQTATSNFQQEKLKHANTVEIGQQYNQSLRVSHQNIPNELNGVNISLQNKSASTDQHNQVKIQEGQTNQQQTKKNNQLLQSQQLTSSINSLLHSIQSPAQKLLLSQQANNKFIHSKNESNQEITQSQNFSAKQSISQAQICTERLTATTQSNFDQKENKNNLKEMTMKMGMPFEDSQMNKKVKEEKQSYLYNPSEKLNTVQNDNFMQNSNSPLLHYSSLQNNQLIQQQKQQAPVQQQQILQSLHGKNSKSLQIKQKILANQNQHQQAQPVTNSNNMNHVKNSVSLSSMQQQQQQQQFSQQQQQQQYLQSQQQQQQQLAQQQQNTKMINNNQTNSQILKVQTNNYFLQSGSSQINNPYSNTNISNIQNLSNNVHQNENNMSNNSNQIQQQYSEMTKKASVQNINQNPSKQPTNQFQQPKKQYMNLSQNNHHLNAGSSSMRVKTEEKDKTFEDYENIQLYTQPSSSTSSMIKKLSSPQLQGRSSYNFTTNTSQSTTSASSNLKKGFPFNSSLQKQNSTNIQNIYNSSEITSSVPTSTQQNYAANSNIGVQNTQQQNNNQNYYHLGNEQNNQNSHSYNNQTNNRMNNQYNLNNSTNLNPSQQHTNQGGHSNTNSSNNAVQQILSNYGGFFSSRNSVNTQQSTKQASNGKSNQYSQRNMVSPKVQNQSSQKLNQYHSGSGGNLGNSIGPSTSKIYNPLGYF